MPSFPTPKITTRLHPLTLLTAAGDDFFCCCQFLRTSYSQKNFLNSVTPKSVDHCMTRTSQLIKTIFIIFTRKRRSKNNFYQKLPSRLNILYCNSRSCHTVINLYCVRPRLNSTTYFLYIIFSSMTIFARNILRLASYRKSNNKKNCYLLEAKKMLFHRFPLKH